LLWYLAAANLLTWYAGVSNSILAAYIKVFHEDESKSVHWETRLQKLKAEGHYSHNVNQWIAVLQTVLAIICFAFPYAATSFASPGPLLWGLVAGSWTVFLATIVPVVLLSYPRDDYEMHWRELLQHEKQKS